MKTCSACKQIKPLSDFSRDKRLKDGLKYNCKVCVRAYSREHYQKNRERCLENHRTWKANNPEKAKEIIKKWESENKDKVRGYIRKWHKKRYATPGGKVAVTMSVRVNESLREGTKAHQSWIKLVGYTVDQLKQHLEKLFKPGMTWENYGTVWHIDHKIPVAAFNFERPDDIDFRLCWSLKNLQPLEASKNHSKCAKVDKPFQPALAMGIK